MFRTFLAFCIFTKAFIENVNVKVVLSFLECLFTNTASPCMIANYVSATKTNFVSYDIPFQVLDRPKIKYFIKAVKIARTPALRSYNVITISRLVDLSLACDTLTSGQVYRAALLFSFFPFLRLSNLTLIPFPPLTTSGISQAMTYF